ncbi:MAG: hypothetical protein ACE19M_00370 [Candidatus Karelsulcia muelleri]
MERNTLLITNKNERLDENVMIRKWWSGVVSETLKNGLRGERF